MVHFAFLSIIVLPYLLLVTVHIVLILVRLHAARTLYSYHIPCSAHIFTVNIYLASSIQYCYYHFCDSLRFVCMHPYSAVCIASLLLVPGTQ